MSIVYPQRALSVEAQGCPNGKIETIYHRNYTVSGKKETKMFFVMSSIKLERF